MPFMLAIGDVSGVIEHFGAHDRASSLLVACSESLDALPIAQDEDEAEAEAEPEKRDDLIVTDRIKDIVEQLSLEWFQKGYPVLAACYHLSIGDVPKAIHRLLSGAEVCLAYALSKALKEDNDDVIRAFAARLERAKMWAEAYTCIQELVDPSKDTVLLLARFVGTTQERTDFYVKAGLGSVESFGEQAEQSGNSPEAVRYHVAARNFQKAVDIGLELIRNALKADKVLRNEEVDVLKDVMDSLSSVDLLALKSPQLRAEVMCYSFYFGLLEACLRGYTPIVKALSKSIQTLIARFEVNFALQPAIIKLMEASYFELKDPQYATGLVNEILEVKDVSTKAKTTAQTIAKNLAENAKKPAQPKVLDPVVPTAALLPSGNTRPPTSLLTGKPITSGLVCVCEDAKSFMREADFFMWAAVSSFSPLLTGHRIVADDPFHPVHPYLAS